MAMKVEQMINDRGNGAMNQFVISGNGKTVFQSYESTIIEVDEKKHVVKIFPEWDYSRTTGKHRNIFFRDYTPGSLYGLSNKASLLQAIKDGSYNTWTIKAVKGV